MAAANATGDWVTLAIVIKTQGRHGEVAVDPHTDVPDRFRQKMELSALGKNEVRRPLIIEDAWPHKSYLVLKFEGVESINDAEALIGAELQIPMRDRAQLDAGWTYLSDLVGCTVFDGERRVGEIRDVQFGAGEAPLLVIDNESKLPYEIPYAEAYLEKLDLAGRQLKMKLPDGMLDVNAPLKHDESRNKGAKS